MITLLLGRCLNSLRTCSAFGEKQVAVMPVPSMQGSRAAAAFLADF